MADFGASNVRHEALFANPTDAPSGCPLGAAALAREADGQKGGPHRGGRPPALQDLGPAPREADGAGPWGGSMVLLNVTKSNNIFENLGDSNNYNAIIRKIGNMKSTLK